MVKKAAVVRPLPEYTQTYCGVCLRPFLRSGEPSCRCQELEASIKLEAVELPELVIPEPVVEQIFLPARLEQGDRTAGQGGKDDRVDTTVNEGSEELGERGHHENPAPKTPTGNLDTSTAGQGSASVRSFTKEALDGEKTLRPGLRPRGTATIRFEEGDFRSETQTDPFSMFLGLFGCLLLVALIVLLTTSVLKSPAGKVRSNHVKQQTVSTGHGLAQPVIRENEQPPESKTTETSAEVRESPAHEVSLSPKETVPTLRPVIRISRQSKVNANNGSSEAGKHAVQQGSNRKAGTHKDTSPAPTPIVVRSVREAPRVPSTKRALPKERRQLPPEPVSEPERPTAALHGAEIVIQARDPEREVKPRRQIVIPPATFAFFPRGGESKVNAIVKIDRSGVPVIERWETTTELSDFVKKRLENAICSVRWRPARAKSGQTIPSRVRVVFRPFKERGW